MPNQYTEITGRALILFLRRNRRSAQCKLNHRFSEHQHLLPIGRCRIESLLPVVLVVVVLGELDDETFPAAVADVRWSRSLHSKPDLSADSEQQQPR